jgi:hypothetical protein
MRCLVWVILPSAALVVCACGSPEQPPAKPTPPIAAVPAPPPGAPPGLKPPLDQATPTQAAAKGAALPDFIILDASQGQVTLPHLAHAKRIYCATCHSELEPGRLAWDKDTAHAYCRDCHKTNEGGPTTCTGCHKK